MITTITMAGKEYPMSFSLMAAKKMAEKYGEMGKALEDFSKTDLFSKNGVEMMVDMLELLISQGCAYKNYFEKDVPVPENAPVIDGKWVPLPREGIEIALSIADCEMIAQKIEECMGAGKKKEVIAVAKNVETRRG